MEASALLATVALLPLLVSLVFWVWGLRHPCRCCSPRIACRSFSTLVATWDGTVFQDWRAHPLHRAVCSTAGMEMGIEIEMETEMETEMEATAA